MEFQNSGGLDTRDDRISTIKEETCIKYLHGRMVLGLGPMAIMAYSFAPAALACKTFRLIYSYLVVW